MTRELDWDNLPTEWTNPDEIGFLGRIIMSGLDMPAAEQIEEGYSHGGGFQPLPGFTFIDGPIDEARLAYAGDPDLRERARIYLPYTMELVVLFEHDFVAIVQDDDTLAVTRMN